MLRYLPHEFKECSVVLRYPFDYVIEQLSSHPECVAEKIPHLQLQVAFVTIAG